MTKLSFISAVCAGLILLAAAGCNKGAGNLGTTKLFDSAAPELKAQWDTAGAALKTNGFATSIIALRALQQANLTPEQLKVVNQTADAVSQMMYDSAQKGEPQGLYAVEQLRALRHR